MTVGQRRRGIFVIATMLLLCSLVMKPAEATANPTADANESDSGARDCISLQQIKRTKVIDDNTILFYMHGNITKKVTLAFKCPSLKFYQSFGYEVYSNRLCARVDSIITRSGSHCPISDIETLQPETAETTDTDQTAPQN